MAPLDVTADLLATIVAATRRIVEVRRVGEPLAALARRAAGIASAPGRLRGALERRDRVNVIAECKRRSPSRGVLRVRYDPVAVASSYARAGAAAISVLTEPAFFDGSLEHLQAVGAAVRLPLLRKDFIVDEYQVLEARAAGADAVLLVVAALDGRELTTLLRCAADAGLDALVEIHDARELERALEAGARIIGVNNRDLRTLEVDIRVSHELIARVPRDVVAISESGLRTRADLTTLERLGYRGFLIGERFMTAEDPGAALESLVGSEPTAKGVKGATVQA